MVNRNAYMTDELQAIVYIDQSDREDLKDDMKVELKLDHLPWNSYEFPLSLVSRRGEKTAPEALTTKYGGPLATRPDEKGQETLTSTAYRAAIDMTFPEDSAEPNLIKAGMRGRARFLVENRTVFQWGKLYFFETFRFRL